MAIEINGSIFGHAGKMLGCDPLDRESVPGRRSSWGEEPLTGPYGHTTDGMCPSLSGIWAVNEEGVLEFWVVPSRASEDLCPETDPTVSSASSANATKDRVSDGSDLMGASRINTGP